MKKFLKTGKKTLSVFLAVLMAFTALVFAAPEMASAVNAGLYDIKVTVHVTDYGDIDGGGFASKYTNYTGTGISKGPAAGITITTVADNGTGSSGIINQDIKTYVANQKGTNNVDDYKDIYVRGISFPRAMNWVNIGSKADGCDFYFTKIEISPANVPNGFVTVWQGNFGSASMGTKYSGVVELGSTRMIDKGAMSDYEETTSYRNWSLPAPTKLNWTNDSTTDNMTLPKTDTAAPQSRSMRFNVLDQYGVVMSTAALNNLNAAPQVTVSATNMGNVGITQNLENNSNNSLYYVPESDYNYGGAVYAKSSLRSDVPGVNSHTVTSTVRVGNYNVENPTKSFNIYDPKYTISFNGNGGSLDVTGAEVFYGESLDSQAAINQSSTYPTSGDRYGYAFTGLYTAKDGGALLDTGEKFYADANTYYAHWKELKYTVIFLGRDGTFLDAQYVNYKGTADSTDAEKLLKEKDADADYHYTLNKDNIWSESLENIENNVIARAQYTAAPHTYGAAETISANCQHGNAKQYTCTDCGYVYLTDDDGNKTGHTYGEVYKTVTEPTCETAGVKHKICTVCGAEDTEDIEIPALGHSYKIEVTKEASCNEVGSRTLTCTRCAKSETQEIPKTQHEYEQISHIPATCASSAYKVMKCAKCGDTYNEYDGLASTNHNWAESYDKTTGILSLTCSVCGTVKTVDIGANLENFVSAAVTTEPTCKEDGVVTVTAGDNTFTVTIGKDKIPHKYKTEVTDATCTADGKIVNVCTVCGYKDEVNAKVIGKLSHDLKEEITTPATCTAAGVKTITCTKCDYSATEAIPATGHKVSEVVVDCTSGGKIKCVYCDEEIGAIAPKAHEYDEANAEIFAPAGCTTDGVKLIKCKHCDAKQAVKIEKTGHNYTDDSWETVVPAGCTTQGVEKRMCQNNCGAFEIRTTDAIGHNEKVTITPATCTQAGSTVTTCDRIIGGVACDYQKTEIIQPKGHEFDESMTEHHAQDCLAGDYTKKFCKNCDYTEITFTGETSGLGHDFSVEKSTVAATCEQDGSKVMQCSRCDETETVVLPKLGHNFIAGEEVPATCTTSAYTVMKCSHDGCDKTYNEYKGDPKGHTWGDWVVTKPSTNTEAGEMQHTCIVDGCNATETAAIPAGGHSFEGAKGVVILAATCHSKGTTKYTCTAHKDAEGNNTCGVSITVETAETPHSLATSITDPKCERIDNGDGTYKDVFTEGEIKVYCTNSGCGYVDKSASCVLAAPSDHTWTAWQTRTEATCNADGIKVRYCKKCGVEETEKITTRPNHEFIATVVAPTCEERGFTTYACKGCGLTYRDDFTNALGHDYDEGVPVEATCTTPGGILYTCKRVFQSEKIVDGEKVFVDVPCGHTKFVEDESKPATGHSMGEWKFVEHPYDKEKAYAKERICMNAGCTYSEYETGAGEDHEIEGVNAYYKVTFYNEWVTDTYDELKDHRIYSNPNDEAVYTKLSKTYKTVELASIYVLKNTEAVYPNKIAPKREKDADWGGYFFEGWTKTANEVAVGKDDAASPADLSKITANTDLYALFKCRDVYYKVRFYNPDGKPLTKETVILHGHSAEWPESFGTPTMPDNITWKYTFKGWAYDYTKIYDDVAIMAVYDATAKKYNIEYYNDAGKLIGTETVVNGQKLSTPEITPLQKEDKKYVYIFTGTWTLDNGAPVNTEHFAVPAGSNEGDTIKVHAKYSKRQKVYPVKLHIVDPYDASAPLEGVSVQVMDSKGQLIATGETDANGDVSFSLYYDQFTFSASRGNYYFEGKMSFDNNVPGNAIKWTVPDNIYMGTIQLAVKENPDEGKKCGCICHTFLGGIWITFMNILYKVFGVKHVCCYDMYAVHGDKLTYGRS